jgi:hypothetical protein
VLTSKSGDHESNKPLWCTFHHFWGSSKLKDRFDRSFLGTNLIRLLKFKIKSHLIDKSQLNYQSTVILKHWHKLSLVENQIAPANSARRHVVLREIQLKAYNNYICICLKRQGSSYNSLGDIFPYIWNS